jgi:AcrR family transcriptional regulator
VTETRQRLIAAATELFQRQGANGTSIKEIVDRAEATTGSLYHFFPNGKDELAAEVITTSGAGYLALFQMIAGAEGLSAADAIGLLFDGAAATLEGSGFVDACPIFTVALEVASANERLREACQRVFASWHETAVTIFRNSGREPIAADELATTVVAAIGGAFVLARTAKNAELMRATGRNLKVLIQQDAGRNPSAS